jgi:hypothetical protein
MRLNSNRYVCFTCGYPGPGNYVPRYSYPRYEARRHEGRGWYVVGSGDGHLAHVAAEDGGLRAAFFPTEEEANACVHELNGTMA